MSTLPGTATPLLRPRSRSSWLILRQSGASSGVNMLMSPKPAAGISTLPENVLQHHAIRSPKAERPGEMQVADQGLINQTACAVIDKLNSGEVTPLDLLDVLEKRISEVDGKVNALPTLCFDRARINAKALMKKPVGERGLLAGLPIPIKDLFNVKGVLNTQGSRIFRDNVSAHSDIVV